ncbi:MAG: transposase [Boseongicola sp. SB0675_bin_26]|nr:transposase [Boseongicola sp. SB0675_bin_26]
MKAVRDAVPELAGYSCSAGQQVLRRRDRSFKGFFRRLKAGRTPGFPRFRGADLRVGDGLVCRDRRLRLVGIPGLARVRWHRELPTKPVHAVVSRSNGKWFVTLQFRIPALAIPGQEDTRPDGGVDVVTCKAESADGSVVLVDPRGTSRRCSGCGRDPDRPKTLGERVHGCDGCGRVHGRDVNAAHNVLHLVQGPGTGLRSRSVRVAAQLGREAVVFRRRSVH